MRKFYLGGTSLILLATLFASYRILHGQEAAPPSVDLYENQPEPTPTLPPNGPELPELKQLDENFKPPSLGQQGDEFKMHAQWRQLKNRTVNDPEVQAAKAYAQAARTDLEKRKRLREYYDVYYRRMSALATAADLKVLLQQQKDTHQIMLAQPRVRPSPTPEGWTPTPTPAATPAKKKPEQKHKKKNKLHSFRPLRPAFDVVSLDAFPFCGAFV
jgi:hypothetical protein